MDMCSRLLFALFLFAPLPAAAFDLPAWQTPLQRDHPMTGTILREDGSAATPNDMAAAVRAGDFVLLGEVHDNADHHAMQAALLKAMVDAGRKPAVVFEMLPRGLQQAVNDYISASADAAGFGEATQWNERGWPDWSMYQPILQVALDHHLPVIAGDLDRATIKAISRDGPDALTPQEVKLFGLDRALSQAQDDGMRQAIGKGHCDLMPLAALDPMIGVQRARDGSLADAMLSARQAGADGAVLIAGGGHARRDYAVPTILAARAPDVRIVVISMQEAQPDAVGADAYAQKGVVDFAVITPAAEREDQCEALRKRFEKKPAN